MSDRVYSLEELVELIPELADANDVACFVVEDDETEETDDVSSK